MEHENKNNLLQRISKLMARLSNSLKNAYLKGKKSIDLLKISSVSINSFSEN
jgi:hypothetical protein